MSRIFLFGLVLLLSIVSISSSPLNLKQFRKQISNVVEELVDEVDTLKHKAESWFDQSKPQDPAADEEDKNFSLHPVKHHYGHKNEHRSDIQRETPPWFCHDKDCPAYTCKNDSNVWETRVYSANQTFLVYKTTGRSLEWAQLKGVEKIYKYIEGANDQQVNLPMTTPVTVSVKPGMANNVYMVSYFLPYKYQKQAPNPNDEDLCLLTVPHEVVVAVRSFGGYATTNTVLDNLEELKELLDQAGAKYSPHYWATAVYDRPQKLLNRHNEVMIFLKSGNKHHKKDHRKYHILN
jgi:hypothetical protein